MPRLVRRTGLAAIATAIALAAPAAAAPEPQPYQANDGKGFRNVLPPGSNGLVNGPQLLQYELNGARPEHSDDQLRMYGDLVYATPGLTEADLPKYFKDASFGVKPDDVARAYSPRDDVTIVRDRGFGVPHVYGQTRPGAMFGLGYVAAEDRLFFIDVLRNLGRGKLSSFAGGSEGNRATEADQWAIAPYTEADLQKQVDQLPQLYGADGQMILDDVTSYVAGINQYISEAKLNPSKMPGEYPAIAKPDGPEPWKPADVIATASLVGGIFGKGGGGELRSAEFLEAMQKRFGGGRGKRVWADFRSQNDPEAPTTVRGKRFPYQLVPKHRAKGSLALPDPGSIHYHHVRGGSGDSGSAAVALGAQRRCLAGAIVCFPRGASNALVIAARESRSGHPLAVFGPQTGYFAPQILMEEDVHAPGIDARGAAFPGVNLYVELGRGRDYAWSATSAGQDIVDTFALPLCNADGSKATLQSDHYRYRGECRQIESLDVTNSWVPTAADQTPPGSETMHAERTQLGLVIGRATIRGAPVIYTQLRSTYMHEVDSAIGFSDFNDPAKMASPQAFQKAAHKIGYTFNWLYADDAHVAYFNSGAHPVRGKNTDPNLPVWGTKRRFEWRNYDPAKLTADMQPFAAHPQTIDQSYITSWNNKQAPAYSSSDSKWSYGSIFRSQLLDDRIERDIAGAKKLTLLGVIDDMEDAGTVDLRGDKDLPLALRVLGNQTDPALAGAIKTLKAWVKSGAHRRDRDRNGVYEDTEAVRIMDAWFPLWAKAQFGPLLGGPGFDLLNSINEVDNAPNNHGAHLGSAYDDSWYGYFHKDLRQALGMKVRGRYSRTYCGKGSLARCRALLASTLAQAIGAKPEELYKGDPNCTDGDQWCWDAVRQRPLGAVSQPLIHWINRPTFQQAVEIQGRAR